MKTIKAFAGLVAGFFMLPLFSFVIAWAVIIFAPVVMTIGGMIILLAIAADRLMKGLIAFVHIPLGLAREAEILGMRGLPDDMNLRKSFSYELLNVLRHSPEREGNKACFCIKKGDKDYFGVLRIGSQNGNFFQKIHGQSRDEVVEKYLEKFNDYRMRYPLVMGKRLIETKDCNRRICPFKALERFSMKEPMLSKKRLMAA
ncbi:MAG: hypothetical protein OEZ13_03185 [Spirochaetia bacterium]|nr:hypothetical protein [Spirochaetia bacterium]